MSPAEMLSQVRRTAPPWAADHVVHAVVVVLVVLAAAVLRGIARLDNNTVSIVFGTAIGYAAGRSGARPITPTPPPES